MAIDPNPTDVKPDPATAEVIENELPTYRAISPGAVLSLVLGLGSVFCFTDPWFLLVAAASIVVGLLSIRKIRRLPDVLTGAGFARTGIALALVFGLSSTTHVLATDFMVNRDAGAFAGRYVEIIKSQPVDVSLWYQQPPDYRKTKKPEEIALEIKQVKSPSTSDFYRDRTASVARIKERLKGQGEEIRFVRIEKKAVDGLTVYANALLELDGPGTAGQPREEFALLELTKGPNGQADDWVVKELVYPYKPDSTGLAIPSKHDDGHGH